MLKKIIKYGIILVIIGIFLVFGINGYVVLKTKKNIIKDENVLSGADCILVLGAGIWDDKPSPMLKDRLDTAIDLYKNGVAKKFIMSGDHGRKEYDEVNVMKKYAIDGGVASEDIFMDHAGFSTYDSIYRAKEVFGAKRIIIVTQNYHLYRALYIAKKLGFDAYGVSATVTKYAGGTFREVREVLARNKDFFKSIVKPKSKYVGTAIPVSGNGDITND